MPNVYIFNPATDMFEQQKQKTFTEIGLEHQAVFKKTEQKTSILNKIFIYIKCVILNI